MDSSGDPQKKNQLILWQFHGGDNQLWRFVPDGLGGYSIVNSKSGGTLEIPDSSNKTQGTNLHVNQPNNTPNEKWKIVAAQGVAKGKGFVIQSSLNGLAVDINGGNLVNGNGIIIWPANANGQLNQTWAIAPV